MKKTRKGFTLVELLIVVAILATLAAVMTASITGQTAKAKAAAIVNNVDACKKAAGYYYAANWDNATTMAAATTTIAVSAYVANFSDFNRNEGAIKYTPDDGDDTGKGINTTTGIPKWSITVNFSGDGEADAIATELKKIPGYTDTATTGNKFKVILYTGEITAAS